MVRRHHVESNIFTGKYSPHVSPDRPEAVTEKELEEQLTQPARKQDKRLRLYKEREKVLSPDYNKMYGSDRTIGGWRYCIDDWATGTVTTIANTAVAASVALAIRPNLRLSQWPGAVNAYMVLRWFSIAPQSAIGTVGVVDVVLVTNEGINIPLCDIVSNSSANLDRQVLIPVPITDPNVTNIGNIIVTLTGTAPTTSVYSYQLGVSYAYLLASLRGYIKEETKEVIKGTTDVEQQLHARDDKKLYKLDSC